MLWLGIYLPLLPLEIFEETTTPFAICEDNTIVVANHCAAQYGIESGLANSTALSLCGELLLKPRNLNREHLLLNQLAELAYQFSDRVVACSNRKQQHSLLLEIAGSLRLFGSQMALLQGIQKAFTQTSIRRCGFTYSMAIANTAKAAEIKARYLARQLPCCHATINNSNAVIANSNTIANNTIANNSIDNNKAEKDNPTSLEIALDSLPVHYLDSPEKTIQQCIDTGLDTLGAVIDLPVAALRKRFGCEFTDYLQQLNGHKADHPRLFVPPDTFQHEQFFIDGLRSHNDLHLPIQQLLHTLCDYLQQRQWQCLGIDWLFTRFSRKKHSVALRFSEPQHQHDPLFSLTQLQLQQLPLDSPVESIRLSAKNFCPVEQQNDDFFSHQNSRGNALLLADTLRGKLGDKSLYALHKAQQILPEAQSQRKRTCIKPDKTLRTNGAHATGKQPTWLFEPPHKLFSNNRKLYHGRHRITLLRGPERIESGWWQDKKQRDYYIAKITPPNKSVMASLCWVFYNRLNRHWYLHGLYA